MSTASWTIGKETAEIIMPDGPDSIDLDRAWPSNWLLAKASSYEWCHVYDGGIDCLACGLELAKKGEGREWNDRKVTYTDRDGAVHEGIEFCTYEDSEIAHCECGRHLGGWVDQCDLCDSFVDSYCHEDDDGENQLAGYLYGDGPIFFADHLSLMVQPSDKDKDAGMVAICTKCLDANFDFDFDHMRGDLYKENVRAGMPREFEGIRVTRKKGR